MRQVGIRQGKLASVWQLFQNRHGLFGHNKRFGRPAHVTKKSRERAQGVADLDLFIDGSIGGKRTLLRIYGRRKLPAQVARMGTALEELGLQAL